MQFFTWNYWFGFPPFITPKFLILTLSVFSALFIGGIILRLRDAAIKDRYIRQVSKRIGHAATWIGVVGLFLMFARVQRAPVFMYRYWLLFLGVGAAITAFRIVRYSDRRREELEQESRAFELRNKYL